MNKEYQLCPKCNGQGIVSKPPYIPGDVYEWSSTSATFQCDVCNGAKVLLPPPPPVQSDSGEAGKGMGDYWGDQWVRMAELCRKQEKETKELREALEEIEKSLYIGDGLNDKEILHFYVEVVKTIKKEIHKALNNNQ